MKLLITGCKGQVGSELVLLAKGYGFEPIGFTREQLDITSAEAIAQALAQTQPAVLINAAAYTAVDRAESESEQAFLINDTGPQRLAEACAQLGLPLLHISSDYVFDGSLNRPYLETDPVAPISVYARSKEAGESQVRRALKPHIILRTSWVFSKTGACFPRTILNAAQRRSELKVVNDQFGGPTSARSIAEILLKLCEKYRSQGQLEWGTYHFSQQPYVSWFEFATQTIELAKQAGVIKPTVSVVPCSSSEFPTPVTRPRNSRLDCGKMAAYVEQAISHWHSDLEDLIAN